MYHKKGKKKKGMTKKAKPMKMKKESVTKLFLRFYFF